MIFLKCNLITTVNNIFSKNNVVWTAIYNLYGLKMFYFLVLIERCINRIHVYSTQTQPVKPKGLTVCVLKVQECTDK